MDKETLFEILIRWNYWGKKPIENLQPRDVMTQIISYLHEPHPIVLFGIRRSGKSSILTLIMQHLLNNGISAEQILFINFEEPLFSPHLSIVFLEKLIALYKEKINPTQKMYLFFDEIQNLPDWEKWIRREADLKENKIFLTGSSAKLLSSEISTLLTGRHNTFLVSPLSFKEYLKWAGIEYKTEVDCVRNKALIRKSLSEYLEWGGFPEVVLMHDIEKRNKILHQYFDDILFRDIVFRYQIRDVKLLQAIAEYYITNVASLHSFNRIKNLFNTSIDNIRRYTAYLEEAQLIYFLNKFSFKFSVQIKGNRKVYVTDTGLRNAISFRFSQDIGRLIENIIAQQLCIHSRDVFYFRNGSECDFIFKIQKEFTPLQVSFSDLSNVKTKKREFQGLISALRQLKLNKGVILTDDIEREEQIENFHIYLQPVWKFLLSAW